MTFKCQGCNQYFEKSRKLICSRCKDAAYCSAECQRSKWQTHKKLCKILKCAECLGQDATNVCKKCKVTWFCDSGMCKQRHDRLQCDVAINRQVARRLKELDTLHNSHAISKEDRFREFEQLYDNYGARHYGAARAFAFCLWRFENKRERAIEVLVRDCLPKFVANPHSVPAQERVKVCEMMLQHAFKKIHPRELKYNTLYQTVVEAKNAAETELRLKDSWKRKYRAILDEFPEPELFFKQSVELLEANKAYDWEEETLREAARRITSTWKDRTPWPSVDSSEIDVNALESQMTHARDLFSRRFALLLPSYETAARLLGLDTSESYALPRDVLWQEFVVHVDDDALSKTNDLSAEQRAYVDAQYKAQDALRARFLFRRSASFDEGMRPFARERRELYTSEYVEVLARKLLQSASRFWDFQNKRVIRIHQLGAVDGRLCFFLQRMLLGIRDALSASNNMPVSSIDRDEDDFYDPIVISNLGDTREHMIVKLSCSDPSPLSPGDPYACASMPAVKNALERFKPDIVLCAWMPPDSDWTAEIRQPEHSVRQYLLIGSPDLAQMGKPWETWQKSLIEAPLDKHPATINGWRCTPLDELSRWQISSFDNPSNRHRFRSRTLSFNKH